MRRILAALTLGGVLVRFGYRRVVAGDIVIDLRIGRRTRPLGPLTITVEAPRSVVYEVIAAPYLGHTPRGLQDEIDVIERGSDLVLAAHRTPTGGQRVTTTVETVRFEEPESIHFRLLRGPVPHVVERYALHATSAETTRLDYEGELGTDLWGVGQWWGNQVARHWERTVAASLAQIKQRAETRATRHRARG